MAFVFGRTRDDGAARIGVRGWGLMQQLWLSPCSRHLAETDGCALCAKGEWVSVWKLAYETARHRVKRWVRVWRIVRGGIG